jgi:alkylation response protein AidB-like acyl-CoA dehydrogenase
VELIFTADHEQLGGSVRRLLEKHSPSKEVRRAMATDQGIDEALWALMVKELDLPALAIPVAHGGAGFGVPELLVVQEELGRSLACVPYFSTVVQGTQLLIAMDDAAASQEYLPAIARGGLRVAAALTGESGDWNPLAVETRASRIAGSAAGWHLDGSKSFVVDGCTADLLLVSAICEEGVSLFAVSADAAGMTRQPLPTLDATRRLAAIRFAHTPARLIGQAGAAAPALARAHDIGLVALAAELLGGAQRCLEMSTEYAKLRYQFGRPIGSFQAIQHKCANMLVAVESSRSAVCYGAWAAAREPRELPLAASLCKAIASDACFMCAAETIQVHGGIGFTWDFDAQLFFKRAKSSQLMLGDAACHRARFADLLDGGGH